MNFHFASVFPDATHRVDAAIQKPAQYVYAYPQYYVLRQDDEPWYSGIQMWFQNLGGTDEDAPSDAAPVDAPEADRPFVKKTAETTKPEITEKNDKLVYLTPASTTVLDPTKRFFILPEQQKIFGSISGPAINPIYNFQPLFGRSSSSSGVSAEPAVVAHDHKTSHPVPVPHVEPTVVHPIHLKAHIDANVEHHVTASDSVQSRSSVAVEQPHHAVLDHAHVDHAHVDHPHVDLPHVDHPHVKSGEAFPEITLAYGATNEPFPIIGTPTQNSEPAQKPSESTERPIQPIQQTAEQLNPITNSLEATKQPFDEPKVKRDTVPAAIDAKQPEPAASEISEAIISPNSPSDATALSPETSPSVQIQ